MAGAETGKNKKYSLRRYQQDAVSALLKDLDEYKSVAAVLPTGAGKSLIMIDLIDHLRPTLGIDGSILILCHLTDPLNQLFDGYKKYGQRSERIKYWTRLIPSLSYDIIFTTMQKMARGPSIKMWKNHISQRMNRIPKYIIIDEAHSYGAASYRQICDVFPDARLIGLSATPFRSNRYSFSQFEKISYTISMGELIELGFLTPPKTEKVQIPDSMTDDAGRIALSYKIWKDRESKRGLVTLIYFPTTDIAKAALASFSQKLGDRVAYIDGSTKMRDAKAMLRDARDGRYDVLLNCQKLETGVDVPNIGSVIMPYPCNSVVRYMQRVGRSLRLFPGKTHSMIYLCGDAPAIESGNWQKLHDKAIKLRDPLPSECLLEELDGEDMTKDKYRMEWTKTAIKSCKMLESDGLVTLSRFLAQKKFPKKYDRFINMIMVNAKPSQGYNDDPISKIQTEIIINRYKLEERHVKQMTRNEASALINGFVKHIDSCPFIIREGAHVGKHCADIHPFARKWIKQPGPLRTLKAWWRAGSPANPKSEKDSETGQDG